MAKIDVYLRSIERFGAAGAILTSGQPITLRFPQGDRHATQVTPHDQLVGLVREIAPPAALEQIDKNRPAKFEIDSGGVRYSLDVTPRPGSWQVVIAAVTGAATAAAAPGPAAAAPATLRVAPRPPSAPVAVEDEMAIERGQYADAGTTTTRAASGSAMLDAWTHAARSSRASDVYLSTGAPPVARVGAELQALGDRGPLEEATLSRELGIVAPAEARTAWTERGTARFTYGDGMGRVRVTLMRDHRGPGAALRLLVGDPPPADRLGLGPQVTGWLDARGLVLVAGPSGSGKTTTIASLVRALGDRQKRVVTLEDPIEILHAQSPSVSQRAVGDHVPTVIDGVAAAMREGADAIVIDAVSSPEAALAVVAAVTAGHLVLASIATTIAPNASVASDRLVDLLPVDRRELGRSVIQGGLLGTIAPVVKGAGRAFEVVASRGG